MKHFKGQFEYREAAETGAAGSFRVVRLLDETGKDVTSMVDGEQHFSNVGQLEEELAAATGDEVSVEEE